jgi:hypothetical protein
MVISHRLHREPGCLRSLLRRHGIEPGERAEPDGGVARPA